MKILSMQFAQEVVMDQHLDRVMICTYVMMRFRIESRSQILITATNLHLVSAT
jgi:hypothetical protein